MLPPRILENIMMNMKNGSRRELKDNFMFDSRLIKNFFIRTKLIWMKFLTMNSINIMNFLSTFKK